MVSLADTASSTRLRSFDFFCELTTGTTLAAGKLFFGSASTTRLFCGMAGEVEKMSAAVTVPSTSARTVAGPPPSLIATKFCSETSSP